MTPSAGRFPPAPQLDNISINSPKSIPSIGTEIVRNILGCKVRSGTVVLEFPNVPNRRRLDEIILADLPCGICLAVDLNVLQESVARDYPCRSKNCQQKNESCHVEGE